MFRAEEEQVQEVSPGVGGTEEEAEEPQEEGSEVTRAWCERGDAFMYLEEMKVLTLVIEAVR